MIRITVANPHGLHARPAARFVQTASSFDALVQVRDLTNGRGPADAKSLNAVATLGAATGHELEVTATGPQAAEAIAAVQALASRNFDEEVGGPDEARPRSTSHSRHRGRPRGRRPPGILGIARSSRAAPHSASTCRR